MTLLLKEEDSRAVDLLLDGALAMSDSTGGVASRVQLTADPSLGRRVAGAQKLLKLLDTLPQIEPPTDLVAKTLSFIDDAVTRDAAMQNMASIPLDRPSL
jgi:hypothetical protein